MEGNLPDLIRSDVNPMNPNPSVEAPIVYRDTRVKDHYEEQMKLYKPCSCGSGKKYKWCCRGKNKFVLNTDAAG